MEQEIEIWKDIPGWEGHYQASTLGRIKGIARVIIFRGRNNMIYNRKERILKPVLAGKYHRVGLYNGDKHKSCLVHRLVASAFLGESQLHVDHINENKLDNRLCNLRYVTKAKNTHLYREKRNEFGCPGVRRASASCRWEGYEVHCKGKYVGKFKLLGDAIAARKAKEIELGISYELPN